MKCPDRKPPMPCETRWCSHRDVFEYFVMQSGVCGNTHLAHWAKLCQLARANLPPGDNTRRLAENPGILKNCEDLLRVFVAKALNSMQRNTTTLGEAVELWVGLLEKVPKDAGGREIVVQRGKQAMECPFFLLANVLDPRFSGAHLSPTQLDLARQFAEEEDPEVALALNLYLARSPPFREAMFHPKADPIAFWHAGQLSGFPQELCSLALRLCGCVASTAPLERSFSTMSHIYGQKRNKLGAEKAGKLTFLFRSLNSAQSTDPSDLNTA